MREAIEAARAPAPRVSVDLNYRRKLWSEADAQQVMRPLMPGVDLVIANEEDLQAVLGIEVAARRRHAAARSTSPATATPPRAWPRVRRGRRWR